MKRPSQHVMEDESRQLLQRLLPSEWIVRPIAKDYGVDAEVEVVDGEAVTGERIWIQLKARRRIPRCVWKLTPRVELPSEVGQDGTLAVEYVQARVKTRLLEYALQCPFPLLLMEADLTNQQMYWIPLRDDVLVSIDRRDPLWKNKRTVTLKIPAWNPPQFLFSCERRRGVAQDGARQARHVQRRSRRNSQSNRLMMITPGSGRSRWK